MSGSVLASIIQSCKAHNKCFTGSPQDATPKQGLHSTVQRAQTGANSAAGDFKVYKKCFDEMVHPILWEESFFFPPRTDCKDADD